MLVIIQYITFKMVLIKFLRWSVFYSTSFSKPRKSDRWVGPGHQTRTASAQPDHITTGLVFFRPKPEKTLSVASLKRVKNEEREWSSAHPHPLWCITMLNISVTPISNVMCLYRQNAFNSKLIQPSLSVLP